MQVVFSTDRYLSQSDSKSNPSADRYLVEMSFLWRVSGESVSTIAHEACFKRADETSITCNIFILEFCYYHVAAPIVQPSGEILFHPTPPLFELVSIAFLSKEIYSKIP